MTDSSGVIEALESQTAEIVAALADNAAEIRALSSVLLRLEDWFLIFLYGFAAVSGLCFGFLYVHVLLALFLEADR